MIWSTRSQILIVRDRPLVMAIVNVTPDSFSDGGQFLDPERAVQHALEVAAQGADILDIGGESTRPYSEPVDTAEELRRVVPVIQRLRDQVSIPISIDTSKAEVARAACESGADIINDVTGLESPDMQQVALEYQVGVCAMHMQGTPQDMQDAPRYDNAVQEICDYLKARFDALREAGIEPDKICLDPGIGFGKTHEHNISLIQNAHEFTDLGQPVLVGHSRKGVVAKLLGDSERDRDAGTLAITLWLAQAGVHVVRVHEVEKTVQALRVWSRIVNPVSVGAET